MSVDQVPGADPLCDIRSNQASGVLVELIVESRRVTGTIHVSGARRRLVDVMNSVEGDFLLVYEGQLDDPFGEQSEGRSFDVAQVPLNAILFGMPREGAPQQGSAFETVAKVPVPGTLLLPGLEVSGDFYVLPDGRRSHNAIIATRGFAPVTDVTIVSTHGDGKVWKEPIAVVNLRRGFLYVPRLTAQGAPGTLL